MASEATMRQTCFIALERLAYAAGIEVYTINERADLDIESGLRRVAFIASAPSGRQFHIGYEIKHGD